MSLKIPRRKPTSALVFVICAFFYCLTTELAGQTFIPQDKLDGIVNRIMDTGRIPGLSLAVVTGSQSFLGNYGFADLEKNEPVTLSTRFELASCSRAFTGLAILQLAESGKINLNDFVSDYIDWIDFNYNGQNARITIQQLLFNTSGIPWNTMSQIAESERLTLEQVIRGFNGLELQSEPGETFINASLNYSILALVVEKVSAKKFEVYMKEEILDRLDLVNTYVGQTDTDSHLSKGYKIGFFKPRVYQSPFFESDNASSYIISDIQDIAKWMRYQMSLDRSRFDSVIEKSQQRDETVRPVDLASYSCGWFVSLDGDGIIFNHGLNPNYSSYMAFNKAEGIGVAILSNSNSEYVELLGDQLIALLTGQSVKPDLNLDGSMDKSFSLLVIVLCLYNVFILVFFAFVLLRIIRGNREFALPNSKRLVSLVSATALIVPFLFGIYLLPKALISFSWKSALVWTPISFPISVGLLIASIAITYIIFIISIVFPEENKYVRESPKILLLSILSGLSNMAVILLITTSIGNTIDLGYILYYFGLTLLVYLAGRKIVQSNMIKLTRSIIYDLRVHVIDKIFSTDYEKFERIDRGRIYTTINDDIGTIGQSGNTLANIATSLITAGGAFIYMAFLAFWATLTTVVLIATISIIYYFVSRATRNLYEEARETRTVYMELLNGMIDGFKEISIHRNKKKLFKADLEHSTNEYRQKATKADLKFVNASIVGELLLISVLIVVSVVIPRVFPSIHFNTIMSFIIIILYLIDPIHSILSSVPQMMQFRISWNRVQSFIRDIPAHDILIEENKPEQSKLEVFRAEELRYEYDSTETGENETGFAIGPIDIEVRRGEILFIIGGNGSGKTTLAKLLTGLYSPQSGRLMINGEELNPNEMGEYYSTVFNPFHLFRKIYSINDDVSMSSIKDYLLKLNLEHKVTISNGEYSTIDLSGGQRKRLALLQCIMEDKPILLFDEWAADQDPDYRRFFYRTMLKDLKQMGKIIIAITHDDHYFDVADKVIKMDQGKLVHLPDNT